MFALIKNYIISKYFRRFKDRKKLDSWQEKQVIKHLKNVMKKSVFYNEHFKGFDLSDWKTFPMIDKKIMMENFNKLNTVSIDRESAFMLAKECDLTREFSPKMGDITVGLSSGTSGNRGLFLVSPSEAAEWAGTLLAKVLPKSLLHKEKIALFMRANSNLYETTRTSHIQFQFYDLQTPLEEHLYNLHLNPPTILAAPPSMLRLLSEKILSGHLKIAPCKVVSIAEVLDPIDATLIEKAFRQKLHQIYQCTEGFLAITCSHGTLHLNEDVLVVQKEYIDKEERKFIPVITDFRRISQPIIRYRLNDILTEKKTPCPCGSCFTALEKIEGRADDIFYLPSLFSDKIISLFPDFVRGAVSDSDSDIEEFLIVQKNLTKVQIAIKTPNKSAYNLVKSSLEVLCKKYECVCPTIEFIDYPEFNHDKKLRRVRSEYKALD